MVLELRKKYWGVRGILARLSYCVKRKVQLEDLQSSRLFVVICLEAYGLRTMPHNWETEVEKEEYKWVNK